MRRPRTLPVAAASVLMLLVVACSGGGVPDALDTGAPAPGATPTDLVSSPDGSPVASPTGSPTGGTTTTGGTGGGTTTTGGTGGTTTTGGTNTPSWQPATLFKANEDRIGITKDKIVLCGHAALSLAPVFNVHPEDLNVYWEYVNKELGGIHGREVVMSWTDDNYGNQPQDVRDAYLECKAKNPFILLGGIGFDQIPSVRTWAEEDHQLYIHHIAREDLSKKYSFSYLASVETIGRLAAEWILKAHAGKRIGVIWRNSEHWEPGHKTFKETLAKRGVTPAKDLPVQKSQSVYTTQINELNGNADVVFIWENALAATEIIQQADGQGYHPQWLVFPFNLMTDTLKRDTVDPVPVEGIATWPAYVRGKTDGPFKRYAGEIERFEDAHHKYGRGTRDDIVWMTWLGNKQLHELLLQCGADCTRNKVVGLLQSGVHKAQSPLCPVDFTRNKHVGAFSVSIFRAFGIGSDRAGWKEVAVCKERF